MIIGKAIEIKKYVNGECFIISNFTTCTVNLIYSESLNLEAHLDIAELHTQNTGETVNIFIGKFVGIDN